MTIWQLQDAKQRFSEVVRAAELGEPQVITRHGTSVAVIIEYEGYLRLAGPKQDFKAFLESAELPENFEWPERLADARSEEIEWS